MLAPEIPTAPSLVRFMSSRSRVDELLAKLLEASRSNDGDAVGRVWEEVEPAVSLLLELEERHLLPGLFASSEREARVLVQEQRHLRGRLVELKVGAERRRLNPGAVQDFIDVLAAHLRHQQRHGDNWCDDRTNESPSGGTRQ